MKKILITGANGLLGHKLVSLLSQQQDVSLVATARGICRFFLPSNIVYRSLDITNADACKNLINEFQPDALIHAAAMTQVDICEDEREVCDLINIKGVSNLIEAIGNRNTHFVHISTDFIYEGNEEEYFEDSKVNPLNYYALSKATIDYWVLDNIDRFRYIQGFRYFNVYGSGEQHKGTMASLVSQFQWQAVTGQIHPFEGSDQIYRDYVWVGDLVNVVLSNTAGSGIFDLGTGQPTSIGTVAQLISLKTKSSLIPIPFPPNLKGKYQYYTKADMEWLKDYKFKTVEEYLLE